VDWLRGVNGPADRFTAYAHRQHILDQLAIAPFHAFAWLLVAISVFYATRASSEQLFLLDTVKLLLAAWVFVLIADAWTWLQAKASSWGKAHYPGKLRVLHGRGADFADRSSFLWSVLRLPRRISRDTISLPERDIPRFVHELGHLTFKDASSLKSNFFALLLFVALPLQNYIVFPLLYGYQLSAQSQAEIDIEAIPYLAAGAYGVIRVFLGLRSREHRADAFAMSNLGSAYEKFLEKEAYKEQFKKARSRSVRLWNAFTHPTFAMRLRKLRAVKEGKGNATVIEAIVIGIYTWIGTLIFVVLLFALLNFEVAIFIASVARGQQLGTEGVQWLVFAASLMGAWVSASIWSYASAYIHLILANFGLKRAVISLLFAFGLIGLASLATVSVFFLAYWLTNSHGIDLGLKENSFLIWSNDIIELDLSIAFAFALMVPAWAFVNFASILARKLVPSLRAFSGLQFWLLGIGALLAPIVGYYGNGRMIDQWFALKSLLLLCLLLIASLVTAKRLSRHRPTGALHEGNTGF
jgi:hypothetical protein